jgi:hypothetical protein
VLPRRIFAAVAGAFEARHPLAFELLYIARVDLLQRRVALVGQIAAVGHPILADRALQQAVDLRIGGLGCGEPQSRQAEDRENRNDFA